MALESAAQFIDDLVATNPAAGDPIAQGDDHIRLLKAVLKRSLPGVSEPRKSVVAFGSYDERSSATATVLADFGISSITDEGPGRVRTNFTTAFGDSNYTFLTDVSDAEYSQDAPDMESAIVYVSSVRRVFTTSAQIQSYAEVSGALAYRDAFHAMFIAIN